MLKDDFSYRRYIYILLRFIKPIKLYRESEIQHVTTAENNLEIMLQKFIMQLILIETTTECKETTHCIFTLMVTHRNKILSKTTN